MVVLKNITMDKINKKSQQTALYANGIIKIRRRNLYSKCFFLFLKPDISVVETGFHLGTRSL